MCLRIIERISQRGFMSKQHLIREFGVSERTIERDMKLILRICKGIRPVKIGRQIEYHCDTKNPFEAPI